MGDGAPQQRRAGIDQTTFAEVEEYGVARLLDELAADLRDGGYRPLPARRVFIPKPGTTEQRPLSIPTVRDRVVQAAVKIVLEPIFEADILPCSFGFRPKRAAHDALQVLIDESWRGQAVGGRDGHRQLFRGDSALRVDAGGARNGSVTGGLETAARDAAGGGDGRRPGAKTGYRHSARRGRDSSNAMGNFCFDVSLSYRRVERPGRVSKAGVTC